MSDCQIVRLSKIDFTMNLELKKTIRALQSRFPYLMEIKAGMQKFVRKSLKTPFEKDFEIIERLNLCKNDLILDIGANRGQSIDAIRIYNKDVQIISFEPNQILSTRLMEGFASDKNLKINNFGLGDTLIKAPLFTPYYYGYMYDGLSSFNYNEAHDWINENTIAWFNPKKLEIKESNCEIKRLDDLNLEPSFIKIDVQGFEKNVLIGGAKTIKTHKPLIMFEINEDAEEYMNSIGWVKCVYENGALTTDVKNYHDNVFFYHPQAFDKLNYLFAI